MIKILTWLNRPQPLFLFALLVFLYAGTSHADVRDELAAIQKEGNAWFAGDQNFDEPHLVRPKGSTGDCDNYAAVKMLMVRARLPRLKPFYLGGYVRSNGDPQRDYHSVLVVPHDGKWYVLDNLSHGLMVVNPGKVYLKNTTRVDAVYSQEIAVNVLQSLQLPEPPETNND